MGSEEGRVCGFDELRCSSPSHWICPPEAAGLGKEEAWKPTALAVTAGTKQLCCELPPCLIYGEGFEKGKFLARGKETYEVNDRSA